MVIEYLLFVIGIFLLIKSSDFIIDGASALAKKIGVSNTIIGLTVVALGTSLPELIVNIMASLNGSSEIIFGNVIGSNITNVLLVLGITAIITNIKVKSRTVWKEIPFALLSIFMLFALASRIFTNAEQVLTWSDSLVLLSLFLMFIYYVYRSVKDDKKHIAIPLVEDIDVDKISKIKNVFKVIIGLVGIYFGGRFVVNGAIFMAQQLGVSEFLISATILAIGTSLPELVVSIMAAIRNNVDLAVGNIVGSSILNILLIIGASALVRPIVVPSFIIIDIGIMFAVMFLLFLFMFVDKKYKLTRKDGIAFLAFYALYIIYLINRG
jgi:cation:H+ antiporter